MTQSEAILEYIDGTLDHDAEQALFDSMARHPELRSTLRQFIGISSAVHADREAYAPPAHVERALLSGLGLAPIPVGLAAGTSATGGLLAWFGGKLGGMALSFVAGLLLAGTVVYWMTRDDAGSVASDHPVSSTSPIAANGTPATGGNDIAATGAVTGEKGVSQARSGADTSQARGAGAMPMAVDRPADEIAMGSGAASPSIGASRLSSRDRSGIDRSDLASARGSSRSGGSATSARHRTRDDAMSSDGSRATITSSSDRSGSSDGSDLGRLRSGATTDRSANGDGTATPVSHSDDPAELPAIGATRLRTAPPVPVSLVPADGSELPPAPRAMTPSQSSPIEPEAPESVRHAFAELRGKAGSSLNPTNAKNGSSSLAFMNNMAVGGYLMITPSFALGVEGGAEAYDQVLNFDTGDTDRVEQRPIYGWGGVAGRYYLGTIPVVDLHTFVQGTLGLTSAGPLGRFRLGTGYDLGAASLNIGVEASTLVYTFNGRPLMSGRWGATVGAEVRLW